jgi:hypothetical protein
MSEPFTAEMAAIVARQERERIIRILKIELAGNDLMLEELIYLINDRNIL